jgi:hypothetical protein
MALATFKDLCIDVADAQVSGRYWSTMLGWRLEMHDDGDAHLRDDEGRIQVWLNVVPEPKSVKNRVHLDVNAESVQRAVEAGAQVESELPGWTMLLDPDGQERLRARRVDHQPCLRAGLGHRGGPGELPPHRRVVGRGARRVGHRR